MSSIDVNGFPFLSEAPLTVTYLAWAAVWVAMVWGLAAASLPAQVPVTGSA